jgi:hypothetical protein
MKFTPISIYNSLPLRVCLFMESPKIITRYSIRRERVLRGDETLPSFTDADDMEKSCQHFCSAGYRH